MTLTGTPLICIVGPTASGKSELAEEVACRLDGAVVSVDAMQVYRGMDIGTAKTPASKRRCELLMVDVCDVSEDYSVQRFQADARRCIDELLQRGKTAVLCGGTGLYLDAVIDEMAFPAGETSSPARQRYEAYASSHGPGSLHKLLAQRDPASAALIHPNNERRIIRALEMADEGVSYAEEHAHLKQRAPHYPVRMWAVMRSRQELYRRIDARVDQMLEEGLVEEVRGLVAQGLSERVTAGQAIGYKELLACFDGHMSKQEAIAQIKTRSRHYAKRQLSWIRRDGRAQTLDRDHMSLNEAASCIVEDYRTALAEGSEKGSSGRGKLEHEAFEVSPHRDSNLSEGHVSLKQEIEGEGSHGQA